MRPKILLVEDHEDTRELMVFILAQSAFEVSAVRSLAEALMLAEDQKFDLFVLDSKLPDGTGVELCKLIRQSDPSTPILFCSAVAYESSRNEALISGAQEYLVKPVDLRLLCSTVDELLQGSPKSHVNIHYQEPDNTRMRTLPIRADRLP